jgi:signal transduction histidine kinase
MQSWLSRRRQRLTYVLVAVVLLATISAVLVAGFRLHHSVVIQRQTLRTVALGTAVLRLHEGPVAQRGRAAVQLREAFRAIEQHDPAEAARLQPSYTAFVAAPATRLTPLGNHISAELDRQAAATRQVNPGARLALILGVLGAAALVALLTWQFELERRAGRIDRDYAERADELIRLRDDFVAVVSHELRTPLTSIIGYLELIMDDDPGSLSAEQTSYLAVVERSTRRLVDLVGDLLVVAEADRGVLALDMQDVDLGQLARDAVEAARPVADASEVGLTLVGKPSGTMQGDPKRLGQMLDNLVSNALKFSASGGLVTVSAARGDGGAVFEVSDTGDGIAEADQAHLFEPFFRSSSVHARSVPGTGLGLTITKAIVDAHNGSIEVESSPGAGTTFRVVIPA